MPDWTKPCPACGSAAPDVIGSPEPPREWPSWVYVDCPWCGRFMFDRDIELSRDPRRWVLAARLFAHRVAKLPPVMLVPRGEGRDVPIPAGFVRWDLDDVLDRTYTLEERMDLTLLNYAEISGAPSGVVDEVMIPWSCAATWSPNPMQGGWIVDALKERGLLTGHPRSRYLTVAGWIHVEKLRAGRTTAGHEATVFVAMAFAAELRAAYMEGFAPAIREAGYKPYRVDEDEHNDLIDDRIVAGIRASAFVVADFTKQRPSVYYEAGLAAGLGKPVVHCVQRGHMKRVAFDANHRSIVEWGDAAECKSKVLLRILATVGPARKR